MGCNEPHRLSRGRAEHPCVPARADVRVALLGDRGASPPVKLGTSSRRVSAMLTSIEPQKHRAEDHENVFVDGLGGQALGHARVALRVGRGGGDLATQDASRGLRCCWDRSVSEGRAGHAPRQDRTAAFAPGPGSRKSAGTRALAAPASRSRPRPALRVRGRPAAAGSAGSS